MVSGLESELKKEEATARGECGAPGVKPQAPPSSTDRRSARANGYDRRERRETRGVGDL
jgi:hypothetical protein